MLVSIVVITYNSSKTVVETLDSILNQSYGSKNIELIIADDASPDNTVEVIEEWLINHKEKFYKICFIKNPTNLGVSGNINTAWKKTSCEWVKSIAGDDLLDTKCIELNVEYVKANLDCKILFSKMQMFGSYSGVIPTSYDIRLFKKDSKEQYNSLRKSSFNIAPSSFINTSVLIDVGYADEKYRMIEDLPLWLKITKSGYQLYFLDAITVYYRVNESISFSKQKYINELFIEDLILVHSDYRESFLQSPIAGWLVLEQIISYKLMLLVSKVTKNEIGMITKVFNNIRNILRPGYSINKIFAKVYNRIF